MQDIELMHMRYALESTVLALGAMEKSSHEQKEGHQLDAICHLKDLRNHLEAINDVPRKVILLVFCSNFYLHSFLPITGCFYYLQLHSVKLLCHEIKMHCSTIDNSLFSFFIYLCT